ncbi:MAG TPA: queuosine precursor transporter [Phycisphaerae bacterium]|nr:queuosine precursor transporter [Phycisphaerae bacterium]
MPTHNELLFLAHVLVGGALILAAGRRGQDWLIILIVICTILMNIAVFKQMTVFGLAVTGGNVLYATVFLANDVLNEHFGRQAARRAVVMGFCAGLAVVILMQIELFYKPNEYDDSQAHFDYFFSVVAYPRIVTASMVSYLLSQLLDVQLYDLIRRWTGVRRLLWLRCNASTWISQAFDTVFFTTAALTGPHSTISTWRQWRDAVILAYIMKIVVAVLDTPFLYLTTWRGLIPPGSTRGR